MAGSTQQYLDRDPSRGEMDEILVRFSRQDWKRAMQKSGDIRAQYLISRISICI
eukprot:COSAG05_NODE_18630_length_305_cov_0.902913_1_plen_53_part_10